MSRRRTRTIRIQRDEAEFAEEGWFSCPNRLIRDNSLSPAARWAYAWMMSHNDQWSITASEIADAAGIGLHAAEDLVYELEVAGYLVRYYTRNALGHVTGIDYKLKARPVPEEQRTAKPRKPRKKRSAFAKSVPVDEIDQDEAASA
jgi:hypothetical protein